MSLYSTSLHSADKPVVQQEVKTLSERQGLECTPPTPPVDLAVWAEGSLSMVQVLFAQE